MATLQHEDAVFLEPKETDPGKRSRIRRAVAPVSGSSPLVIDTRRGAAEQR